MNYLGVFDLFAGLKENLNSLIHGVLNKVIQFKKTCSKLIEGCE